MVFGCTVTLHGGVVLVVVRLHGQAKAFQRGHVWMHGPGPEVASAGIGKLEGIELVHQGAEEHQDGTRAASGTLVDGLGGEFLRAGQFEILTSIGRGDSNPDGLEDVADSIHLLDAGDPAQHGATPVEHRGAEQRDGRVLGGTDLDLARKLRRPGDLEVDGALGGREYQGHLERGCQSLDHVERDVLLAHLYPVNGGL